jgi:hypothetical protein
MYGNAYLIHIKAIIHTHTRARYITYNLIHNQFPFRICCNAKMTENKELKMMQ